MKKKIPVDTILFEQYIVCSQEKCLLIQNMAVIFENNQIITAFKIDNKHIYNL